MSLESSNPDSSIPPARPRSWSIALRLVLLFTVLAALLLLVAMAAAYWAVTQHVLHDNDRYITEKLTALRADIAADSDPESLNRELRIRATDKTYAVRVLDPDGRVVAETPRMHQTLPVDIFPKAISVTGARPATLTYHTRRHKIFALVTGVSEARGQRLTLQLAQDRTHDERFAANYAALLTGILGCAILTCAGIAYLVTRRGLRPLKQLAESVERVGATHLDERVAVANWPNELQPLAVGFNKMLARLEESFSRLSHFSADLAHELRTPIAILQGEAEGALTKPRPAEQYREVIESSLDELQRLSVMIDNLLFLARAEKRDSFNRSYFDGRAALEKIREFYEAISQDQGVEIYCSGEGEIYAEPVLFRRALINLITNALRFTPSGGSITVTLDRRNGGSNVSVTDTGCGISSQHVPHVFNRFFRGDAPRNTGGTGLGLAIVKSIMQIHDGQVSVHSELNKGTVVTLTCPDAKTNGAVTRRSNLV
ncbi:MAG TPA: heavy metal sensor histidine kinase [Chthoniobacteraceae bacterium]|nr:heavy metal sensor histidine kinase [Chthoniobacteraceae bacterium]